MRLTESSDWELRAVITKEKLAENKKKFSAASAMVEYELRMFINLKREISVSSFVEQWLNEKIEEYREKLRKLYAWEVAIEDLLDVMQENDCDAIVVISL